MTGPGNPVLILFSHDMKILISVEDRFYLGWPFPDLFDLGGTLFLYQPAPLGDHAVHRPAVVEERSQRCPRSLAHAIALVKDADVAANHGGHQRRRHVAHATALAKQYLSYFQGSVDDWEAHDQRTLRHVVPENRLRLYDMRDVLGL